MKRIVSLVIVLCVVLSLGVSVQADSIQHQYSSEVNSGIRHEVCTTLLGTTADSYYTGDYTYYALSGLQAPDLLLALRQLVTETHTHQTSYSDCRDLAVKTDCENGDGTSISLLYSSYSATWDDWCNNRTNGWNREHVWPCSLMGIDTPKGATVNLGTDLHHVRPSDLIINDDRGNKKYGNVSSGSTATSADYTGNIVGGTYNSTYFEPLDNVKGDVARICLYMYVRYGGISRYNCSSITNVFESVDVLLEWCALDPVDTWEMGRNEVVAAIQGNRNVFIDYPELAWLLFEKAMPADMVTPSGEAAASGVCNHGSTAVKNAASATCGRDGYSGDTYCALCGELLSAGSTVPATGQHRYGEWAVTKEATQTETGIKERTCTVCGHTETEVIPTVEPTVTEPPVTEPPVTEPPVTEPPVTDPSETEPPVTQPTTQVPTTEPTEATVPIAAEPSAPLPAADEPGGISDRTVLYAAVACGIVGIAIAVYLVLKKKK